MVPALSPRQPWTSVQWVASFSLLFSNKSRYSGRGENALQ